MSEYQDSAIVAKYKEVANARSDFQSLSMDNFILPSLDEMVSEDLMQEILGESLDDENILEKNEELLNIKFYTEEPFVKQPGYYPDKGAFVVRIDKTQYDIPDKDLALNAIDGDTFKFGINSVDDGGQKVIIESVGNAVISYDSFKDYWEKLGGSNDLTIRCLGIDTPEIPKYQMVPVLKSNLENRIEEKTYKEILELKNRKVNITLQNFIVKKDGDEYTISEREEDDIVKLLSFEDSYAEIVKETTSGDNIESVLNMYKNEQKNYGEDYVSWINEDLYEYFLVVTTNDESVKHKLSDGLVAQQLAAEELKGAEDIMLVLSSEGLATDKEWVPTSVTFYNYFYIGEMIKFIANEWEKHYKELPNANYNYIPFGMDNYRRALGVVYVKKNGNWINLNKYILCKTQHTAFNVEYDSPELQAIGSGLDPSFNMWSYDRDNILWLDTYNEIGDKNYYERLAIHEELLGIKFKDVRECGLLLGDTFMLTPPESIRDVSQSIYEKVPNIRSKGTSAKHRDNTDHILELTLYFYEDAGINGMHYKATLPNGDEVDYYMNGLRGLIAQFKIAPYLPIENGYINDILGVEAVTLRNMHIETVEGIPRLLRVILTLKEFNYRVFMPDMPVHDDDDTDDNESNRILSSTQPPMFAKSFNWEIFRWYYQRALQAGDRLYGMEKGNGFTSYDYSLEFYANKNAIGPWDFCSGPEAHGGISFYIPDENWLNAALQIKNEKDKNALSVLASEEETEESNDFLNKIAAFHNDIINPFKKDTESELFSLYKDFVVKLLKGDHIAVLDYNKYIDALYGKEVTISGISNNQISVISIRTNPDNEVDLGSVGLKNTYLMPMVSEFFKKIDPSLFSGVAINETITANEDEELTIIWDFVFQISEVNSSDLAIVKTMLEKHVGEEVFKDNLYRVRFQTIWRPDKDADTSPPEYTPGGQMVGSPVYPYQIIWSGGDLNNITDEEINAIFSPKESVDELALRTYWETKTDEEVDGEVESTDSLNDYNEAIDFYVKDYKNPANMPFVEYLVDVPCRMAAGSIANTFTEVSVKAIEGVGPQYMGGQDVQLQLQIITDDGVIVSSLKTLPILASSMAKQYRKIIPAWPIKIKTDMARILGTCEVLIDTIDISTVEGHPGVYSITMQITSVDRTQRQKESLKKLNTDPVNGRVGEESSSDISIDSYFAINKTLGEAELYPDLDIPTLAELGEKGFRFIKYDFSNRTYPDPDFYIIYNYVYTSLAIKKLVKDTLVQYLLTYKDEEELLPADRDIEEITYTFKDYMGAEYAAKVAAQTGIELTEGSNDIAKSYIEIMNSLAQNMRDNLTSKYGLDKEQSDMIVEKLQTESVVKNLWLADICDGWEIKSSWEAPLAEDAINLVIRDLEDGEENAFASEIVAIRTEAIELIDKILNKPLNYTPNLSNNFKEISALAINKMFFEDEDGKSLIELLCPSYIIDELLIDSFNFSDWDTPNPWSYLRGFLFASGCALSGGENFSPELDDYRWHPNQYAYSENQPIKVSSNGEMEKLPYALVPTSNGDYELAWEIEKAINPTATDVGAWRIKRYSSKEDLLERFDTESSYDYASSIYKDINSGYADPYYNNSDVDTKSTFSRMIATNIMANAHAFLRVVLISLRKMICDGLLISEIDIMARDWEELTETIAGDPAQNNWNPEDHSYMGEYEYSDAERLALLEYGFDSAEIKDFLAEAKIAMRKSFCARLIYPFLVATTSGSRDLYDIFKSKDYSSLEAITGYVEGGNLKDPLYVTKFLSALQGIGMTIPSEEDSKTISVSQKLFNELVQEVFIKASEDPRGYLLHSFYDMLVNDKRGRLVRAFPTYYVIFVDEGRKLGSWKLHDNFYSMNAISNINVVKSRKIAADTCSLTMNNVFNSYTMESNPATSQQYTDMYGLKDVFDSIFSPKAYFEKEKAIRLRQTATDTVLLQAGIRIHVRAGYSADASQLPIIFNGKVAEVEVADVVQIIAQGDGHELSNPLNVFGEIEAVSLDTVQEAVTWFKDLRGNWSKGGMSPRDLLSYIVSARYGGIRHIINDVSDGTWFNNNPFGITHFGDPRFTDIFDRGETTQNIYEVSNKTALQGTNTFTSELGSVEHHTPIINTNIEDKTAWDLLHLAANSGVGYIGAVTDFGFRSTMFLGKPNHYYAYGYDLFDGKIVEKRKPYQQFHYYDSYTDIIHNSIRASEAAMKTNAVGMWTSTNALFGSSQSTVGPIYLDMNIYPEYQKSMTVDTTLVATGNGGIDINLFTHHSEKWATSEYDDKVNKQLAWRVTANALKNSVKDMYQGDVAVLGDPSIKPYDRVYIHDTYEDMSGMFEVEAVVHSMSGETGFTTSILPDVIARHEDTMEIASQSLLSTAGGMMAMGVAGLVTRKLLAGSVYGRLATSIAKSDSARNAASTASKIAKSIQESTGFKDFLEERPSAAKFFSSLNTAPDINYIGLEAIEDALKYFEKLDGLSELDDIGNLVEAISKYNLLDKDNYRSVLEDMLANENKYGIQDYTKKDIDNAINEIASIKDEVEINSFKLSDFDEKKLADEIFKLNDVSEHLYDDLPQSIKDIVTKWASDDPDLKLDDIQKVLKNEDILNALKTKKISTDSLDDFFSGFRWLFTEKNGVSSIDNIVKAYRKGDILKDFGMIAKGFLKTNAFTLVIQFALDCTVSVLIRNAQEVFTRYLQSVQAVDVYPLMKHGRPLTAGMTGSKGAIQGYPTYNGYDSIQGMIMNFYDGLLALDGNLPLVDILAGMFLEPNLMADLSLEWRQKLGLDTSTYNTTENMAQTVYGEVSASYAANSQQGYALMTKPRITKEALESPPEFYLDKYKISGLPLQSTIRNEKLLAMNYVGANVDLKRAMHNERFEICHLEQQYTTLALPFESGVENVPVKTNDDMTIFDFPIVQDELIYILTLLTSHSKLASSTIFFRSGVQVNAVDGNWSNTGFSMRLECSSEKKIIEVLDELKGSTNIINGDGFFDYAQDTKDSHIFTIVAYPSIDFAYEQEQAALEQSSGEQEE